jgi:dienelactone hydrolase
MLDLVFAAALCTPVTQPFVGTLCSPNDGKRHAAMIVLGGSEGGDSMKHVASMFANRGYVAASVAYFNAPGLPPTLVDVPVETVGHAIEALEARPDVRKEALGILGGSRGGELALLAASTYPQIKAVVAVVPSPYAYMGLGEYDIPTGCAWTYEGKPLPCIPPDGPAGQKIGQEFQTHQPIVLTPLYDASRNDDAAVTKAATFALQKIDGPVLCLGGKDDQMWDSQAHCDFTIQYLRSRHHPYRDREIVYPNAGHTFISAVHGPSSAVTQLSMGGATMAFGGTPAGDAEAATDAWKQIWNFLAATLTARA